MPTTIHISPVTRIEGHLSVETEIEAASLGSRQVYRVKSARSAGDMFRGFETLLEGRDPLDAQQIVQRICGVCPISHALASVRAQEMIYGIKPSRNGRLLQNLIQAANTLQSHILHFYQFAAPDYVDVTALRKYVGQDRRILQLKAWIEGASAGPLLPRFEGRYLEDLGLNCSLLGHYAEALEMRRVAHEAAAVFAARMPHSTSIVPGGCTHTPTEERIKNYRARVGRLRDFVERVYLPDVVAVARAFPQYWEIGKGYGNLLCYGSFELNDAGQRLLAPGVFISGKWEPLDPAAIGEETGTSWFSSPSRLHPSQGRTVADPQKAGAYSWLKAPRYKGLPMEVGPLARILVNCRAAAPWPGKAEVDKMLGLLGVGPERLVSVLGRLACRALESVLVARQAAAWIDQVEVDGPPAKEFKRAAKGTGFGLVEAPRGALGHWMTIEGGKIKHYQCVVPTTWNCSPRDDSGRPGPLEKALEGLEVADPKQPIEAGRVVRSFDPCMACAVH